MPPSDRFLSEWNIVRQLPCSFLPSISLRFSVACVLMCATTAYDTVSECGNAGSTGTIVGSSCSGQKITIDTKNALFAIPLLEVLTPSAGVTYKPGDVINSQYQSFSPSSVTIRDVKICSVGLLVFVLGPVCESAIPLNVNVPANSPPTPFSIPTSSAMRPSLLPYQVVVTFGCSSFLGLFEWCSSTTSPQFLITDPASIYGYNFNSQTGRAIQPIPLYRANCSTIDCLLLSRLFSKPYLLV
jgi:hypothetical protein